jgi:hypothetical protein
MLSATIFVAEGNNHTELTALIQQKNRRDVIVDNRYLAHPRLRVRGDRTD